MDGVGKRMDGATLGERYATALAALPAGERMAFEPKHNTMVSLLCRGIEAESGGTKNFRGYQDEEGHWVVRRT